MTVIQNSRANVAGSPNAMIPTDATSVMPVTDQIV
jgi:hypothetical protein